MAKGSGAGGGAGGSGGVGGRSAGSREKRLSRTLDRLAKSVDENGDIRLGKGDVDSEGLPTGAAKELLDANALFTAGNVESVRDPSAYDAAKADGSFITGTRYRTPDGTLHKHAVDNPSKAQYEEAHRVMRDLGQAPLRGAEPVYRGMRMSERDIATIHKTGSVDMTAISSWSFERGVSEGFAGSPGGGKRPVLFVMRNPTRGSRIKAFSTFKSEEELVFGGRVRVVGHSVANGMDVFEVVTSR